MHRRFAPLLLAVLVALPVVAPVDAARPTPTPSSEPSPEPTPIVEPTPTVVPATTVEPTPTPDPTPITDPSLTDDPSAAPPVTDTTAPAPAAQATTGRPDANGRYIVMLKNGSDTAAVVERAHKHEGVKADRSYTHAVRGFAAKLDKKQRSDLLADPSVVAVVPDQVIELTQTIPTGVSRVGGRLSDIAGIDGTDQRVDADVAIVDTGIAYHPDLNVAGGYNCSTSDHTAWRDKDNHGTHVAGTVAALDNSFGVVGVAPGARVWGVKILNDDGYGLISWYICGLDWVLAQRDPTDSTRPLFEAVNMSVTKNGSDDHNCGLTNHDALHQAICRVVGGGITVVAAAANDHHNAAYNIPASYDEVITVSALADTDGIPGGLGGNRCFSWGGYDKDDTFADFSNYGADVDIIAPGKCIMSTVPGPGYAYMSGTSMAAPTVTGAVALYKASRPNATPAEVREALRYLGNLNWAVSTDPDPIHEPLLDVSRISTLGTFDFAAPAPATRNFEGGSVAQVPFTIVRSPTFFERVQFSITSLPAGWTAPSSGSSLMGWTADSGQIPVNVPKGTAPGSYTIGIKATNQGRTATTTGTVNVVEDSPTAGPPLAVLLSGARMRTSDLAVRVVWSPATDPSSPIAGYEVESSMNGGPWTSTVARTGAQRDTAYVVKFDASYRFRVRAMDTGGNWSPWVQSVNPTRIHPVDDRSAAVIRHGSWIRRASSTAWRTTLTESSAAGASLSATFTGHGVAVVGPKTPHRGNLKIYVDGAYITTIGMRTATPTSRLVAFTRYFATGGTHTITVRVVRAGAYPVVQLDAFVISR